MERRHRRVGVGRVRRRGVLAHEVSLGVGGGVRRRGGGRGGGGEVEVDRGRGSRRGGRRRRGGRGQDPLEHHVRVELRV